MNTKISLDDLKKMENESIVECLSFFGKDPLANLEGKYIWDALVKVKGSIEQITDTDLRQLGWVLREVPEDDMRNFTLNEVDTISSLGQFRNLSESQVLAERVLEDWANKEPQEYTYYDLIALQHILCGFNRSLIESIHPDSYKEAASTLATLQGCPSESLEALAVLAQSPEAFGPATGWKSSQLKNVGCIINGIPSSVLTAIPLMAFEALTPDIVPCIFPETLKALNAAQLSHMTPSAVAALTTQQQSVLNHDQHKSLVAAYEGVQNKPSAAIMYQPMLAPISLLIVFPLNYIIY